MRLQYPTITIEHFAETCYPFQRVGKVKIDDDVREEYWSKIRKRPDLIAQTSFRSGGKYTKRNRGSASKDQTALKPGKRKRLN